MKSRTPALLRHTVHHPLTVMTIFCRPDCSVLLGAVFGKETMHGGMESVESADSRLIGFGRVFAMLLDGKSVDCTIPLDLHGCTPFQRRILDAARRIPRGTTISYRRLAAAAGRPRAARAAASVMRRNRFPLIIPCHRVVNADGTIGGFCGKKTGSPIDLKRRLLLGEGVILPAVTRSSGCRQRTS